MHKYRRMHMQALSSPLTDTDAADKMGRMRETAPRSAGRARR
ncbi:hypothetical protein NMD1_00091 [Novosphingobium sp. MD-1]|nr:hypothetical protein NMD1_00091 [Novosphingobium sp. MD-1]